MAQLRGGRCVGVLREVKSAWERRTPLIPSDVSSLVSSGVRVLVQPSTLRIFTDAEFAAAGATITEDLSPAHCIVGVKEFPPSSLLPDRSYLLFSHTIKAQPANMAFLDEVNRRRVRLFDYESIRSREGKRLVAFGQFAGMAGMIDGLRGLGERMLSLGLSTPFMGIASTYMYPDLSSARRAVEACGDEIRRVGLPQRVLPFNVAFTGAGNVTQGALSIFELLPHRRVHPRELSSLPPSPHVLHQVMVGAEDMVEHPSLRPFDKHHYYANPTEYTPTFHSRIAPHTSMLVNGMYWDTRYPRLITCEQWRQLQQQKGGAKMLVVADISCDVGGGVEFLKRTTSIDRPFFVYDGVRDELRDRVEGEGVVVLGVDNLPAEFPRDASIHFSSKLAPFVPALAGSDATVPLTESDLPPELFNACIASHGQLTPNFQYIDALRKANQVALSPSEGTARSGEAGAGVTAQLLLSGHLIDSSLLNLSLDVLERLAVDFRVLFFDVSPNRVDRQSNHSHAVLEATFEDEGALAGAVKALQALALDMNQHRRAQAKVMTMHIGQPSSHAAPAHQPVKAHTSHTPLASASSHATPAAASRAAPAYSSVPSSRAPNGANVNDSSPSTSTRSSPVTTSAASTFVSSALPPHILVLGSGFVAAPLVSWLSRHGYPVTVASNVLADAQAITASLPSATATTLDASNEAATSDLVRCSALTVSLLPHTFHPAIARLCLTHSTHLLTASYVSPAMRALHAQAQAKRLIFMNELGLDPGIDHLSAMQAIARIGAGGRRVVGFSSVCGGLPAPEAANNPFAYKFSWSPAGMLGACVREARWREGGQLRQLSGDDVLSHARPYALNAALALEVYPNHDSLIYEQLYGLQGVRDMFRGTLRYRGTSDIMRGCKDIGLLGRDATQQPVTQWRELIAALVDHADLERGMRHRMQGQGMEEGAMEATIDALRWLGALSEAALPLAASAAPFDQFCSVLASRLQYASHERDMVILTHRFTTEPSPSSAPSSDTSRTVGRELLTSTLIAYGDVGGHSAMAKTVGLPAAMGARLIVEGGVKETGVLVPVAEEVYRPILQQLEQEGVRFTEHRESLPV